MLCAAMRLSSLLTHAVLKIHSAHGFSDCFPNHITPWCEHGILTKMHALSTIHSNLDDIAMKLHALQCELDKLFTECCIKTCCMHVLNMSNAVCMHKVAKSVSNPLEARHSLEGQRKWNVNA